MSAFVPGTSGATSLLSDLSLSSSCFRGKLRKCLHAPLISLTPPAKLAVPQAIGSTTLHQGRDAKSRLRKPPLSRHKGDLQG